MKVIQIKKYQCEKCGELFDSPKEAIKCESKAVEHDKGIVIGNKVKIINGRYSGYVATVYEVIVYSMKRYGYVARKYWHTIGLLAFVDNVDKKSKNIEPKVMLRYDEYEPVKHKNK